ncbi:glycosyltransferase family 2 protein [bacterium]|nr:glycosyltransferase family 2 protein [bacterium]
MAVDHSFTLPMVRRPFPHVFVLCTGRCGSLSLAKACGHFTNYTSGHETNRATGPARLTYPEGHIEVDNRLAWFLGAVEAQYGSDAFYLHLVRDENKVAASYDRRWHHHGSLIRGFNEGICGRVQPAEETARELVETVNANIRAFLRDKPHTLTGDIDDAVSWFPRFTDMIGARGDLNAALAEFDQRHNKSEPTFYGQHDGEQAQQSHSRESLPVARLKRRCDALAAESARLRRQLKTARRIAWALAAPWLLAAAPLTLPILWLATRKRGRRTQARNSQRSRWPRWLSFHGRSRRTLIYDAFLAYRAEGPEQAAKILDHAGGACPAGAQDLFRAMSVRSDTEWLAATNAWAATASLPEISLAPAAKPRFERMRFAEGQSLVCGDKVSVIMPAFNAQRMIAQAAESILCQSWQNLELIIVDDCSTDGTAEIAGQLAARDPRVRVLRNPANVGPYVSKNLALLVATGRFVTGHDADDIAIPTRIADQMQPICDDTNCVATIASMIRLDRDGIFSHPTKIGPYSYDGIARRAMISLLLDRRVLLEQIGFWDTVRFGADSELLARATAVLGPRLREVRKVTMLCLNAEGSLTNNADTGITVFEGISPIRKVYREAWAAWHATTPAGSRRLPFPHVARQFDAPKEMLVDPTSLRAVLLAAEAKQRQAA